MAARLAELNKDTYSQSDLHLLLLSYYGGSFSSYSSNYYLLNIIDKGSVLYNLFALNDTLETVVGSSVVSPVQTSSSAYSHLLQLIQATNQLITETGGLKNYEFITANLLLGHLYLLVNDSNNAIEALNKVNIDLAKLTDLQSNNMETDVNVVANFYQYCAVKKAVLLTVLTKDTKTVEYFFTSQLLNVPSVSNLQARYWLNVLYNSYFKLLFNAGDNKEQRQLLTFELLLSKFAKNSLILIVIANYYYLNFTKYLSADFKATFQQYFNNYLNENIYNNKNLKFPLSNESNYSLETLIYVLIGSIKESIVQPSYYDSRFTPFNNNILFDLTALDNLVDFSLSKTYQSIKIFSSLIFLKILQFNKQILSDTNLETRYKFIVEVIANFKNFITFYNQFILKIQKKNISHTLLDEDSLLLVQTYSTFLKFIVANIDLKGNQSFYHSVLNKSTLVIEPEKRQALENYNSLLCQENLNLLTEVEGKLIEIVRKVQDLTNIDLKVYVNEDEEDQELKHIQNVNQTNFLKSKLSSSKILNLLLSNAYHAIIIKKVFFLKVSHNYFKRFIATASSKYQLLNDYKKCLVLNNFNNLNYYFDFITYLLKFYRFDKFNQTIIYLIQKILAKKFDYWKCWNLFIILANSDYGLETSNADLPLSFDPQAENSSSGSKNAGFSKANFGVTLAQQVSNLASVFVRNSTDLLTSRVGSNLGAINELKNDLIELKLTEVKITAKKLGYDQALTKLPELFELFHNLFSDFTTEEGGETVDKNVKTKSRHYQNKSTINDDSVESKIAGHKLFRFHSLKKHRGLRTTIKALNVKDRRSTIHSDDNSNSMGKIFAAELLQKLWLYAANVYIHVNLLKEAEYSIIEAENVLSANEFTTYQFAKLLQASAELEAASNVGSTSYVKRKLCALNEYEKSIEIFNINHITSNFRFSENFKAIIGLAGLILNEEASKGKLESHFGSDNSDRLVNDLDELDYDGCGDDYSDTSDEEDDDDNDESNDDNDESNDGGSGYGSEPEANGKINRKVSASDIDTVTQQLSETTVDSFDGRHGINNETARSIFINANDNFLAILRIKSLIENNLVNNYYYFNNEKVWDCLNKIYLKINDELNYEAALERTIEIQESKLARDLNFFDKAF